MPMPVCISTTQRRLRHIRRIHFPLHESKQLTLIISSGDKLLHTTQSISSFTLDLPFSHSEFTLTLSDGPDILYVQVVRLYELNLYFKSLPLDSECVIETEMGYFPVIKSETVKKQKAILYKIKKSYSKSQLSKMNLILLEIHALERRLDKIKLKRTAQEVIPLNRTRACLKGALKTAERSNQDQWARLQSAVKRSKERISIPDIQSINSDLNDLTGLRIRVGQMRKQRIEELSEIFKIEKWKQEFAIVHVRPEMNFQSCLSHAIQLILGIASILDINVYYPIYFDGNRSLVYDNEWTTCDAGISLLEKDVQYLINKIGVKCNTPQLLEGLYTLIEIVKIKTDIQIADSK